MGRIKGVKTAKVFKVKEDEFRHALENSTSFTDVAIKLGYTCAGQSIPNIKERAGKLGIDIEHIDGSFHRGYLKSDLDLKNGRRSVATLRKQLKQAKRPYICENCNCEDMTMGDNGEWQWKGRDLLLEINHRFGHRFEGCNDADMLQYLCSPCHRQHTNLFMWAKHGLNNKFTTGSSDSTKHEQMTQIDPNLTSEF